MMMPDWEHREWAENRAKRLSAKAPSKRRAKPAPPTDDSPRRDPNRLVDQERKNWDMEEDNDPQLF